MVRTSARRFERDVYVDTGLLFASVTGRVAKPLAQRGRN